MKIEGLKTDKVLSVIISFSLLVILAHLYTNIFAGYGIFRDEYYYIACSKRPAMGYVDHPPFSIYILMIIRFLFGESLFAIRLLPALAGGIMVFLTGTLVRKMGGGMYAVIISFAAITGAPLLWGMFSSYSMNFYEYIVWLAAAHIVIRLSDKREPKLWAGLGIVLGLGLLNKISVLWLGAGIFFALLLTPLRSVFKTRCPYGAAVIALLLFIPFVIWNFTHDFAHLEFMRNASGVKYSGITRMDFITGFLLDLSPFTLFIWLPGLLFFFFNKEGKKFMPLGIMFLTAFLILLLNGHSKTEYLGSAFPLLFAGGGVMLERFFQTRRIAIIKYALPVIVFITGLMLAPFGMPVLPVDTFVNYSQAFGAQRSNSESKELSELPQFYADMHGWEEMAKTVSRVYMSLPESERKSTAVFANNYGEAASIEYYRKKYPLPKVLCGHNSYWFWSKDSLVGVKTIIITGGNPEDHRESCAEVTEAARVVSRYAMPYENHLPVYVCRKFKRPLQDIWEWVRFYI